MYSQAQLAHPSLAPHAAASQRQQASRPSAQRSRRAPQRVAARSTADDWQPVNNDSAQARRSFRPVDPSVAALTSSRAVAYAELLSPVLSILGCAPGSAAAIHMLRSLLTSDEPLLLARCRTIELDDALFETFRHCWDMGMRVLRTTPRGQDAVYSEAMAMLDRAWAAAAEARACAVEPELSLLKRLMNAWSPQERARLLSPPEAARALTTHAGLFFSLLDQEWQRCAQQDAWGDAFLEGQKAQRLATLAAIRCEAKQRASAAEA